MWYVRKAVGQFITTKIHLNLQGNVKSWDIDIIVERLAFFDRERCNECLKDDDEGLKRPVLVVKKMEYFSHGNKFPISRDILFGKLQETLKSQFL